MTVSQLETPIAAYHICTHVFRVVLTRGESEQCVTLRCDSDRFCTVCATVNAMYPGWAIVESWEV